MAAQQLRDNPATSSTPIPEVNDGDGTSDIHISWVTVCPNKRDAGRYMARWEECYIRILRGLGFRF